ncbi:hypothetical protein, partial [Komagataeibacter europaeus]|uniref:hypothetical protein n=1 Tax=Komagataeibacter europaeus TaxID=33995 RepID=UPI001E36CBFD
GIVRSEWKTLRKSPWFSKTAELNGTSIAETILASSLNTATTGRTYGCKRHGHTTIFPLARQSRPHMGSSAKCVVIFAL